MAGGELRLPGEPLPPAELLDEEVVWPARRVMTVEGKVTSYVRDEIETPDGDVMLREYLVHPGAVAILALDDRDRVAVVRQFRHPTGMRMIEIPAGLLDVPAEAALQAAQRELAEEAELSAAEWNVLLDVFTTPGSNQESIRIFLARGLAPAPRPEGFVLEHEELHMDLRWVGFTDLVDAIYAGRVQSPTLVFGVLALHAARLEGRLDTLRSPDAHWPARGIKERLDARLA